MISVILSGLSVAIIATPIYFYYLHLAAKKQEESLQRARVVAQRRRYNN